MKLLIQHHSDFQDGVFTKNTENINVPINMIAIIAPRYHGRLNKNSGNGRKYKNAQK